MDRMVFIPTVVLGMILVFIYLHQCWKNNSHVVIGSLILLIMQSSGVVVGFFLALGTIYKPLQNYLTGLDYYIFISGIAIVSVSIQGIYRDMRNN